MMEKGNLTLEEWSHLSEEEKGERYRELSDHDKLLCLLVFDSEDAIVVFTIGDLLSALRFQMEPHKNYVEICENCPYHRED